MEHQIALREAISSCRNMVSEMIFMENTILTDALLIETLNLTLRATICILEYHNKAIDKMSTEMHNLVNTSK